MKSISRFLIGLPINQQKLLRMATEVTLVLLIQQFLLLSLLVVQMVLGHQLLKLEIMKAQLHTI